MPQLKHQHNQETPTLNSFLIEVGSQLLSEQQQQQQQQQQREPIEQSNRANFHAEDDNAMDDSDPSPVSVVKSP